MYLWAQSQVQPLSPGIYWTLNGLSFKKSIMKAGTSFGAMQWLYYMQATDCIDKNGERVQMQHAYFNDEHVECGFQPDGFAVIDGECVFYEYLGRSMLHRLYFKFIQVASSTPIAVFPTRIFMMQLQNAIFGIPRSSSWSQEVVLL